MFEAHFGITPDSAAPHWAPSAYRPHRPEFSLRETAQKGLTRRLQSLRHACPLHAWAATGKRKDASGSIHEHWFLYIEYCTGNGTRVWQKLERNQADCSLDTLFEQALWAELPRIDSARTRHWLEISSTV